MNCIRLRLHGDDCLATAHFDTSRKYGSEEEARRQGGSFPFSRSFVFMLAFFLYQQLEICRYTNIAFRWVCIPYRRRVSWLFATVREPWVSPPYSLVKSSSIVKLMCLKRTDLASWSKQEVGIIGPLCASSKGREGMVGCRACRLCVLRDRRRN